MEVFSKLARKLMSEEFRQQLLSAENAHAMTSFLDRELALSLD